MFSILNGVEPHLNGLVPNWKLITKVNRGSAFGGFEETYATTHLYIKTYPTSHKLKLLAYLIK